MFNFMANIFIHFLAYECYTYIYVNDRTFFLVSFELLVIKYRFEIYALVVYKFSTRSPIVY